MQAAESQHAMQEKCHTSYGDWDWDWHPTIRTPAGCWRGDGGEGGIEVPDPDPDL
jgi:hypothetical protein